MKILVIVTAALAAAGAASAQSSVTLFGAVDAAVSHGRASGPGNASRTQLTSSGSASSRLGLRGREDLGGGLFAAFWLEAGLGNDSGLGQPTNTSNQVAGGSAGPVGLTFNRRSTVMLGHQRWGEVRLGREYTPQFWNHVFFDPFENLGAGATLTFSNLAPPVPTSVRASNSITYLLPSNIGGLYGQAIYHRGENAHNGAATQDDGNGTGLRLGYAGGALDIALALSRTEYAAGDARLNNLGASWNFGPVKVTGIIGRDHVGTVRGRSALLGAIAPVGVGTVKFSYSTYRTDRAGNPRSDKLALGYVHNLSKRTALYATLAAVRNRGGATAAVNAAIVGAGGNQRSSGFDLGVRHLF